MYLWGHWNWRCHPQNIPEWIPKKYYASCFSVSGIVTPKLIHSNYTMLGSYTKNPTKKYKTFSNIQWFRSLNSYRLSNFQGLYDWSSIVGSQPWWRSSGSSGSWWSCWLTEDEGILLLFWRDITERTTGLDFRKIPTPWFMSAADIDWLHLACGFQMRCHLLLPLFIPLVGTAWEVASPRDMCGQHSRSRFQMGCKKSHLVVLFSGL